MLIGNGDVYGKHRRVGSGGTFACARVSSALASTRLPVHLCSSRREVDMEGSEMDVKGLAKCFRDFHSIPWGEGFTSFVSYFFCKENSS